MLYQELTKDNEIFTKIDKMKVKLPAYTLVKAFGLTTKKILSSHKNLKFKLNLLSQKTDLCLINLAEIFMEKEKNIR